MPRAGSEFDAVVVGSGPNGLAAAVALGLFVGNWAFPAEVDLTTAGRSFDEGADVEETAELFELAFASDESVDGSALYGEEELP